MWDTIGTFPMHTPPYFYPLSNPRNRTQNDAPSRVRIVGGRSCYLRPIRALCITLENEEFLPWKSSEESVY